MVRFFDLMGGRLLWFNVLAVLFIKIVLPLGGGGLANLGTTLGFLDVAPVIERTNEVRAANGLDPLSPNAELRAAAQAKLEDMAERDYFGHVSPDGTWAWAFISDAGYRYDRAGENLARGFYDADRLVDAWMASDAHRENLLNGSYTDIGMASGRMPVNGRDTLVVVQLFAAHAKAPASVAAVPSPTPEPEDSLFGVMGAQAVSTDHDAPAVSAPVPAPAFADDAVERTTGAAERGFAVWLLLLASLSFGVAVMERRPRLLLAGAFQFALLTVLTTGGHLAAFTGYVF